MTDAADQDATITMFTEISGLSREAARNTLAMYNYNLEEAINFILEGQADELAATSSNNQNNSQMEPSEIENIQVIPDEEFVREPIPPKRETMILPEEDNFRCRKKRVVPSRSICPLRNFELEGRLQEEHLEAFTAPQKANHLPHTSKRHMQSASNSVEDFAMSRSKRSRLEYLYRPPVEICFSGSFQAAKDYAQTRNRWLVVNLQDNTDFKCQILNRDIWSSKKIREILQKYYVFWQVAIDNSEGMRFKVFYGVNDFPYICVLDPRTGEEKYTYKNDFEFKETKIIHELMNYLSANTKHPNPELAVGSSSDKFEVDLTGDEDVIASPSKERKPLGLAMEPSTLSEEEQINLAIQRSLREAEGHSSKHDADNNDCEDLDPFSSTDEDSKDSLPKDQDKNHKNEASLPENAVTYEDFIGSDTEPITRLQLRLPDGERHILEWPCTTQIKALKLYIPSKFPDITKDIYKVICPFSSIGNHMNVLDIDDSLTLKEANLHPNAILHIQKSDN